VNDPTGDASPHSSSRVAPNRSHPLTMASLTTAAVSLRAPAVIRASGSRAARRTPCVALASKFVVASDSLKFVRASRAAAFNGDAVALRPSAPAAATTTTTTTTRRRLGVVTRAAAEESTAQISKKVARTADACKKLGRFGFWGQLVLTTVSAVILVFSFLFKGITKATDAGLYFILFGICASFFTTFWSLGIVRLGDKLRKSAEQLNLVPPRAEVVRQLSTGLTVNFGGLGATIVGLQATCGILFAKSLTAAAASPFTPGGYNPVLALDIFLIQAGANTMLAHWLGAAISLWLLRTVNLPSPGNAK
jgi:hypothetical protein